MSDLTHVDQQGKASMVDVSNKEITERIAVAESVVEMSTSTLNLIKGNEIKKGDVLSVARIAGIQAAKKCSDLIPLCHPLALSKVSVDIEVNEALPGYTVTAMAKLHGKTGVEMEALTACSVALLTIYDMAKAVDRGMEIEAIRVVEKKGGKSGHWKLNDTGSLERKGS